MKLLGVFPCPWVSVIRIKVVHPVHYEHCFHGVCSKTAVQTRFGEPNVEQSDLVHQSMGRMLIGQGK